MQKHVSNGKRKKLSKKGRKLLKEERSRLAERIERVRFDALDDDDDIAQCPKQFVGFAGFLAAEGLFRPPKNPEDPDYD